MRISIVLACAASLLSLGAEAANGATRVTGLISWSAPGTLNGIPVTRSNAITFDCSGEPVCTGTYVQQYRVTVCNAPLESTGQVVFSGLDLARSGTFSGTFTMVQGLFNFSYDGQGNCAITAFTADYVSTYTGTWDGNNGTIAIGAITSGPFKADRTEPVFPMTVNTTVQNGRVDSTAQIAFRPQDVGTQGSIFVFAMAPLDRVVNPVKHQTLKWTFQPTPKDTPVQCVLAQLSTGGQLVGVSAATLQAYVTGVLSSQGASVTILNGVPTANIGGATFFVGYGATGTAMLNGGVNRSAVTVPGAQTCQPQAPQTGWWWNPREDGRGFSIEKHGSNLFFASFLYDVSGRSTWYVSSGRVSLEGSLYVGDLLAASGGQALGGAYSGPPRLDIAGPLTMTFDSATSGTLVWPGGTVPIERLPFVPDGLSLEPMPNRLESGWWWNESESGRGFFMEFQGDWLDVAGYMYDENGDPVWYLTVAQMTGPDKRSFSGNWWSYANGQTLMGAWKPNVRINDRVAPVTITFTGADSAIMTLPNNRTTSLRRHRF